MKIAKIFKGNEHAYGTYYEVGRERDDKGKISTKNVTLPLPEGELLSENTKLWSDHLNGTKSLGVIPINKENLCGWGCIDIDFYKEFNHKKLLKDIDDAGFPLIVCKSKSGGAHGYVFLKNFVNASELIEKLGNIAAFLGYKEAEIFPKQAQIEQGGYGNYVNMPYFNAENTKRCALKLVNGEVKELTLEEFYEYHKEKIVDYPLSELKTGTDNIWPDGPPCNNCIAVKKCKAGGRNNFMFNVGVYLRKKAEELQVEGEEEIDWFEDLKNANKNYCEKPLGNKEITDIYASVNGAKKENEGEKKEETESKLYQYMCKAQPMKQHCLRAECIKRRFGVGRTKDDTNKAYEIIQIHKLEDDPVRYYVTFANGKTMSANEDQMTDQKQWRKKVFRSLDYKPKFVKDDIFTDRLNMMMRDHLSYIEHPGNTKIDRIREALGLLFSAEAEENDTGIQFGGLWHDKENGLIYFKTERVFKHLVTLKLLKDTHAEQTEFIDIIKRKTVDEKGNVLRVPGFSAEHKKIRVGDNNKQYWTYVIKDSEFDLEEEGLKPKEQTRKTAL